MQKRISLGMTAVAVLVLGMYGCGSSSSETSANVTSISDLPTISTMVDTTGASGSISVTTKAISGTPPLLTGISSSNADTYFWNGLLATISTNQSATQDQINSFWEGEGACRMAQTVGYSFQNILQGGTSMCYMQKLPNASNGVAFVNTDATPSTLFKQTASNKTVNVQVSNMQGGGGGGGSGPENIFIKVYGSGTTEGAAGYAADLWFCSNSNQVTGYEKIRKSSNTLTVTSTHSEQNGNFVGIITGSLTTNSSGGIIFDGSKTRNAQVYFAPTDGSNTFMASVSIDGTGLLTARNYQNGSFGGGPSQISKRAIFGQYSGSTMPTLRFLTAGFAFQDAFSGGGLEHTQSGTGAVEYSGSLYTFVSDATNAYLAAARGEDFSDSIYSGSTTAFTSAISDISGFSCSATPDIIATVDFSQSGPQAIASQCENSFQDMNFCDSQSINAVRQIVMTNQRNFFGQCSTTSCSDDFSCQQWADNNIGNQAGITTANANCNDQRCCAAQ